MTPVAWCLTSITLSALTTGLALGYLAEEPYAGPLHRRAAWLALTVAVTAAVLSTIRLLQVAP